MVLTNEEKKTRVQLNGVLEFPPSYIRSTFRRMNSILIPLREIGAVLPYGILNI